MVTHAPLEYLGQKPRGSENQSFLDEGVMRLQQSLGVLGGQVPRLYGGTIFGGCNTLWGSGGALKLKVPIFDTFATA